MIKLIVTIFAGLGFCASVHFVIHLIGKLDKNAKKEIQPINNIFYWYVIYCFNNGSGRIFLTTTTKDFKLKDFEDEIRKGIPRKESNIVIDSFTEVTKEFYEANTEKLKDK